MTDLRASDRVASGLLRKRLWLWMVVALVLVAAALLAFLVAERLGGNEIRSRIDGRAEAPDVMASTGTTVSVVQDYVQYADTLETRTERSRLDPTDVAEGLRRLAGALGVLDLGSPELPIDLRVTAEHLLLRPESAAIAATVRAVLIEAAAAIGVERRDVAASLHQSAAAVDPNKPIAGQAAAVRQFLRRSADALEPLARDATQQTRPAPAPVPK